MSEFKGTKAEWHAVEFAGFIILKDSDYYEAKNILDYSDVGDVIANANAKLAICAPKMLQMLIDIVEQENISQSCHDCIYDLIKKATT